MPSKKKPRPLFEVPEEIGSGHESGWVYRSGDGEDEPGPQAVTDTSIPAMSANALTLALAALAQTFVLTVTIAVMPMTLGIRMLESLVKPDESR
jgi:hypothetical protein